MINNYLPQIKNGDSPNFFLMAGPCAIESEEMALRIAERIVQITDKLNIPYIFKGSIGKPTAQKWIHLRGLVITKPCKF